MDRSSLAKPGPLGIGGTIKHDKGNLQMTFSGPSGLDDSNRAEFIAFKGRFKHFQEFLLMEADLVNAIRWAHGTTK